MATYNREIQEKIMKDIRIKNPQKVYFQYMVDDRDLIEFIDNRNKYKTYDKNNCIQNGGGKTRKLKYEHGNKIFILYEKQVHDGYDISIRRQDDLDNSQTCLHIMINTELHLAYINNISYYKDCIKTGLDYPGGGSILLKMCIQFLKDTKDRYNVSRLQLKDNSYFRCTKNKESIRLSILNTLIFGETWYGKYGFRPYNSIDNKPNKQLLKAYDNNKSIVKNTKVKDTNLFNYLYETLKELKPGNIKENKKIIDKYYEKHKDLTISQFFRRFLIKFQDACELFSMFYINYYDDQKLHSFFGESFYLDI